MQAEQKPLILTLRLDEASQQYFNSLRQRYFPPERNYLDAHLTLFHQLRSFPATFRHESFTIEVTGVYSIGNGVAFRLESDTLLELHRTLSRELADLLIPQDKQKFIPHITIQNKVTPVMAKQALAELQQGFKPFHVKAEGLDLWQYLGGPWSHKAYYPFAPNI